MKFEKLNKEYYIFIDKCYIVDVDYNDKKSVADFVKTYIFRYRNKLNLNGFYKIKVYSNKCVGLFLEISCLEENQYPNTLDLRILVYLDQDVYFSCDDYFLINDFDKVYYFENKFYCFVDKEVDISLLDFGCYVYNLNLNKKRIV